MSNLKGIPETPEKRGKGWQRRNGWYIIIVFILTILRGKMTMKKIAGAAAIILILVLLAVSGALADKTVLMTIAGDCTLGSEGFNRKKEDSFFAFVEKNGYDYFFANFRDLFDNDDLTVVNLEGVLSDSAMSENKHKTFRFRGDTHFVNILTGSSVEAVSIANNHIDDFGEQGVRNTKKTLEENGVGWFQNDKYWLYDRDGIKIAFFGLQNSKYYALRTKLTKMWKQMKETDGVNAIVVYVHTGIEYVGEHEQYADVMASTLIDMGADLVLMSHPHVLQGTAVMKNRTVFFSMGNFVFGGNSAIKKKTYQGIKEVSSLYSMAIQVKMTFTNEGEYLGQRVVIYPAYTSDDPDVNHYQPKRLTVEEAKPVWDAIQRDTATELPPLTEVDGLAVIEFPYVPAAEGTMHPEGTEEE